MNDYIKKYLPDFDCDTLILDKESLDPATKPPAKYKVLLLNDDFTPMDFVVEVLIHFFGHDDDTAFNLMMKVHHEGCAVCGIYTSEIAESKVKQVTEYARNHEHPLLCKLEKADN